MGASKSSKKNAESAERPVSPPLAYMERACSRTVRSLEARTAATSLVLSPFSKSKATSRSASVKFQRENCVSMASPNPLSNVRDSARQR